MDTSKGSCSSHTPATGPRRCTRSPPHSAPVSTSKGLCQRPSWCCDPPIPQCSRSRPPCPGWPRFGASGLFVCLRGSAPNHRRRRRRRRCLMSASSPKCSPARQRLVARPPRADPGRPRQQKMTQRAGRRAGGRGRPPRDHELHLIGEKDKHNDAPLNVSNGHRNLMMQELDRCKAVHQERATVYHEATSV
jgi:hypothetical protein